MYTIRSFFKATELEQEELRPTYIIILSPPDKIDIGVESVV